MSQDLSELKGEQIGKTAFIEEEQTGPNFEGIPFKVRSGMKPPLDGFAVVERDDSDSLHYGRISSGQELNPDAEAKKMSRDDSYEISDGDVRRGDRNPKVTRIMTVEILGDIREENGEIVTHQPEDLPQTGQGVYEVAADNIHKLLNIPAPDSDEGFNIGEISSGDRKADYRLPEKVPARHVAILGRTGTGKTHTAHVVVEELIDSEIPVVSFDVLNDATNMAEELGGTTLRPGGNLSIPYSLIGYSEFSGFMPELSENQEDVLSIAYEKIHRMALRKLRGETVGEDDDDYEGKLDFSYLYAKMRDDDLQSQSDGVRGRAINKVRPALESSFLGEELNEDWTEMIAENPMLNIDIGHLGQKNRTLVIAAMARILQRLRDKGDIPPFVLLIDEAHKYIPSESSDSPSTGVIRDLVQTARHIGIGTILISQSPSSLDDTALRTCNTHIVLALDHQEMSSVKGLFGDVSASTLERVPKLEKGLAMVGSARDLIQHTSKVDIRDRETEEGAPTPELAEDAQNWFEEQGRSFGGEAE